MLSTLEANFVQEYKTCGNATQALKAAGYKFSSPTSARIKACRLLKRPDIIETLGNHQAKLLKQIETPSVTIIPQKTIELPTREQYAGKAWERASDESQLKDDIKHKYFETTGKALGFVRNDDTPQDKQVLNIIANELHLTLSANQPGIIQAQESNSALSHENFSDENNVKQIDVLSDAKKNNSAGKKS